MRLVKVLLALLFALSLVASGISPAAAHDPNHKESTALKGRLKDSNLGLGDIALGGVPLVPQSDVRCEDGMAWVFPCHKVDLDAFVPLPLMDSSFLNDVWGWEDSVTGMQLAIVGSFEGTIFVDVTDGQNPVYLGTLDAVVPGDFGNIWGDVRVYGDAAYIGTEAIDMANFEGNGIQVVDLTQFRGATGPMEVAEAARISDVTNSHNLSLNVDTGRLYVVGSTWALSACETNPGSIRNGNGGALIYDVATDPLDPQLIGCMTEDGYTHDVQCVIYHGPDSEHRGKEICIGSNEDTLTIYDATDAADPQILSILDYQTLPFLPPDGGPPNYYTHQGWLSEDHEHFFLGDELDEFFGGNEERSTYIWDVSDLDNAYVINAYTDGNESIDHNMFTLDDLLVQANYTDGLTIYDTWKADQGRMKMRGHFDIYPDDDSTIFAGAWGVYPYFGDGKVILTGSEQGLFILDSRAKSSAPLNNKRKNR